MALHKKKRTDLTTLGGRLRHVRRENDLTQEQLAVRAGTSQAVIQKIENGKSLRPRKIDRIAEVLSVNPAWLQFGAEEGDGLEMEAVEVAKAWARIAEPERSKLREEILAAAS